MIFNKSDIEFLDSIDYQKYKKAQKWLDFDFGDIWIERLIVVFLIISIFITPFIVLGPITEYSGSIIKLIILYLFDSVS